MLGGLLEPTVVCLREGVEIALVLGIFLGYLQRTGRAEYARVVYAGLGAALLASVGIGAILWRSGFNPDNPGLEGVLMLVAATLVGSLLVWMWRTARGMRRSVEQHLDAVFAKHDLFVKSWAAVATFGSVFVMVLREGVETVIFLLALAGTPGSNPWLTATGACAGTILAGAVAVLLVRGSARINLRRFFAATGIALALLVLKLMAGAVHELSEAGLIAVYQLEVVADVLTSRSASALILFIIVAAPLVCMAFDAFRQRGPKTSGARS